MRPALTGVNTLRSLSLSATFLSSFALASPAAVSDQTERRILAAASTEAAAFVAQADAMVHASPSGGRETEEQLGRRLKQAWELYARAWTLVPRSALPPRGICRLAILIGDLGKRTLQQQAAAQESCRNALVLGGTPEDMRNRVAAWVMGPAAPSMDDLVTAFSMSEGIARVAPGQPWGHLARLDLARRLGDPALYQSALSDLRRVPPAPEDLTAMNSLSRSRTSFSVLAGRIAILFAFVATGLHALGRRRRARHVRGATAFLVGIIVLLLGNRAFATASPPPHIPSAQEQLDNPLGFSQLLLDLTARAQEATARGDHATAASTYRDITKAVPQSAYSYARLCDSLEAAGQSEAAIDACRTALTRSGIKESDFTHFVRLLLSSRGAPLGAEDRRQIDLVIEQLGRDPRATLTATRLRCNVATHERDLAALDACTKILAAAEPNAPSTISFQWALAFERRNAIASERLLWRARRAGVDAASLARMQTATRTLTWERAKRTGVWAAGGAGLFLFLFALRTLGKRVCVQRNRAISS